MRFQVLRFECLGNESYESGGKHSSDGRMNSVRLDRGMMIFRGTAIQREDPPPVLSPAIPADSPLFEIQTSI